MNIFGIGPLLAIVGAATGLAIMTLEKLAGLSLSLPSPWRECGLFVGIALLITGMSIWASAGARVKSAYGRHQLVTGGAFGLCRNPMYAAIIVFMIPGIAFVVNDLMLVVISAAMCIAFKLRIRREEEFLAHEFGEEYEQYRKSVAQLIPFVRL